VGGCAYASEVPGEQFCPRDGAYLVDPKDLKESENDPLLGRRISEFAIVARVGTGGMGTVYRAIQIGMDRQVALKVLRADLTDDPQVVQRFLQEAKATARLQHRNLAITYTSGSTSDALFYIAMEYISGGSLAQLIERAWVPGEGGPTYTLELSRAMRLFFQIVNALSHAHRLGIVHRDLKPDNVLLQQDDEDGEQAKVVDFGIAKILINPDGKSGLVKTDAHANLGTALYMAPERFAGAPGDPRLDVYALGLLLHEMITGLLPFANRYEDRETPTVLLHKRLTMNVPHLTANRPLSPQLVALHADLLDREPLRRPASAGEVRMRLREIPELASVRGSLETSLGVNIPPAEATVGDAGLSPVEAARSPSRPLLPPSPAHRLNSDPAHRASDEPPPAARPPQHNTPLDGISGTPASRSLPLPVTALSPVAQVSPASVSVPPVVDSPSAGSAPEPGVQSDTAVVNSRTSSRSLTTWLLAGCVVLLVLLAMLALW